MFKKIRGCLKDPYCALGYDLMKVCPRWMADKY